MDEIHQIKGNRFVSEDDSIFVSSARRRQFGYDSKHHDKYTEVYKVAKRWLASKVGMMWNDVWADICDTNLPKEAKLLREYIREYVDSLVYLNCFEEDGAIYTVRRFSNKQRVDKVINYGWKSSHEFYVHDGILCLTVNEKYTRPKNQHTIKIGDTEYHKKDDVWYRVVLKGIDYGRLSYTSRSFDSLRKKLFSSSDGYRYYGRPVYCSAHFPLKNKELKAVKAFIKSNV